MLENNLFAALAGLVARSKVDEVGPGSPNAETPIDEFGGNVAVERRPKPPQEERLPDPELRLLDREDGTIEYGTTTGSGVSA